MTQSNCHKKNDFSPRTRKLSWLGFKFLNINKQRTGETVNASTKAPASAKA